jgi:hypothetical protein
MLSVAQVVAVILVSIVMGPALAHALELPGKMRLTREAYLAVPGGPSEARPFGGDIDETPPPRSPAKGARSG